MVFITLQTHPVAVANSNLNAANEAFNQDLPYDKASSPVKRIDAFPSQKVSDYHGLDISHATARKKIFIAPAPDLSGARLTISLQECCYLFPRISSRNGDRLADLPR